MEICENSIIHVKRGEMMNGQMFQIASIVAASKKALQLSEPIRFSPLEYENKIEFAFYLKEIFKDRKIYCY